MITVNIKNKNAYVKFATLINYAFIIKYNMTVQNVQAVNFVNVIIISRFVKYVKVLEYVNTEIKNIPALIAKARNYV